MLEICGKFPICLKFVSVQQYPSFHELALFAWKLTFGKRAIKCEWSLISLIFCMDMGWIVVAYIHCDDDAENILITGNVLPRFPVVALYVQFCLGHYWSVCYRWEEVVL